MGSKYPGYIIILCLIISVLVAGGSVSAAEEEKASTFNPADAPTVPVPDERPQVLPDREVNASLVNQKIASSSPGYQIGTTSYDYQHNGAMGRQIASHSVNDFVHMVWMAQNNFVIPGDRTIKYQAYDPSTGNYTQTAGGLIVPFDYAGYTTCAAINDGSAVIGLHEVKEQMYSYDPMGYYDTVPATGNFAGMKASLDTLATWYYPTMEVWWPVVEQHYGTDSVTYLLTRDGISSEALILFRKVGNGYEGSWDNGTVIDSTTNVLYTMIARQNTDSVVIVFADDRSGLSPGEGSSHDLDLYYLLSEDQGLTWGSKTDITNYTLDSLWRAFSDFSALFTSDGVLHIIWSARILNAPDSYENYKSSMFHWSSDNGRKSIIDEARYDMDPPCQTGSWNLYLAKPSLSECDNKLYALYTKFGGEDAAAMADCSQEGYANGELYLAASNDYGLSWDTACNITNSRTPNGDSCLCESDHWSSMPYQGMVYDGVPDTLDIVYINDKDPGGIPIGEGYWCSNPVMHFRTACRPVDLIPRIQISPGDFSDTIYVNLGQQLDTTLTLTNIGNETLHWTAAFDYSDSTDWLQLSDSSGTVNYAIGNTQSVTLSLNAGGLLDEYGQIWTGYVIISSDDPGSPDSIEIVIATETCFDSDGDGFGDPDHPENSCPDDNCPNVYNPAQEDSDADGVGDSCEVCNPPLGDANNDGSFNIGDAVYMTYFFCDGSPLVALCKGDVDGDCDVDPLDVLYMVEYIFAGGPAPVEGCDDPVVVPEVAISDTLSLIPPGSTIGIGDRFAIPIYLFNDEGLNEINLDLFFDYLSGNGIIEYDSISYSGTRLSVSALSTRSVSDSNFISPDGGYLTVSLVALDCNDTLEAGSGVVGNLWFTGRMAGQAEITLIDSNTIKWPIGSAINSCDLAVCLRPTLDLGTVTVEAVCTDTDGDGYGDPGNPENTCPDDNCPLVYNPLQEDTDADGVGDSCDACPGYDDLVDDDGDGAPDSCDNCLGLFNPDQNDADDDGLGDYCDTATTWYVKADGSGDFPTIQAAIDGAGVVNDTILLAAGTYIGEGNRDLDFNGKAIVILSESGPEVTIIDCDAIPAIENRRAFYFHNGEDTTSVISGITVVNGLIDPDTLGRSAGGAILCRNQSSPLIDNCIFYSNTADSGGAIYAEGSVPLITSCEFIYNNAGYGAGVASYGNTDELLIDQCLFGNNLAVGENAGVVRSTYSVMRISSCTFVDNRMFAYSDSAVIGYEASAYSRLDIENTIIAYNDAFPLSAYVEMDSVFLSCCDLYGNSLGDWYGAYYAQQDMNGNMWIDPIFCDTALNDFHLDSLSPCVPGNPMNACGGLLGALDPGCQNCLDNDGDSICAELDNCPETYNLDQTDSDGDEVGDICDICPGFNDNFNSDGDSLPNGCDNCPYDDNPDQTDSDGDGVGDVCDVCEGFDDLADSDGDNIPDSCDNCPELVNPDQLDADADGLGDLCDPCPDDTLNDTDGDSICGDDDNCPDLYNPDQVDDDNDDIGNLCDNCPDLFNHWQEDGNEDGVGDACSPAGDSLLMHICSPITYSYPIPFVWPNPLKTSDNTTDPGWLSIIPRSQGLFDKDPNVDDSVSETGMRFTFAYPCSLVAARVLLYNTLSYLTDTTGDMRVSVYAGPDSLPSGAPLVTHVMTSEEIATFWHAPESGSDLAWVEVPLGVYGLVFEPGEHWFITVTTATADQGDTLVFIQDNGGCNFGRAVDKVNGNWIFSYDLWGLDHNLYLFADVSFDADPDGDGIAYGEDNCPLVYNPDQDDFDSDNIGDSCDNCLEISNPGQEDGDADGYGDRCDPDRVEIFLAREDPFEIRDTIRVDEAYQFCIEIANTENLGAMQLGLTITSVNGVTWQWNSQAGGYGDSQYLTVVSGSRMDPPNTVWDLTDMLVTEQDMDGVTPDTVMPGGVALSDGLSAGSLEHMVSLHFTATSTGSEEVGTLCIDSTFVPPGGDWIFVDAVGQTTYSPAISGPYCWPVMIPCPYDSDDDGFGDPGYAENICPDDNCPSIFNPDQGDADSDGEGDACDDCTDTDGDGLGDAGYAANTCPEDNCADVYNPGQEDADGDGIGDECDTCTDTDNDGFGDPGYFRNTCPEDNCPFTYNPVQDDNDSDGKGDSCDVGMVDFDASPQCGGIPMTVGFSDLSSATGTITDWYWDFGDGNSSNDQNPTHEYTEIGVYDVMLIISDGALFDTLIRPGFITTQEDITADFMGVPTHGPSPLTVVFEPLLDGVATEYFWDFGDGNTSPLANPIHIYNSQGSFDVMLIVGLDLDGCIQSDTIIKTNYVIVNDLQAEFTAEPTAGIEPLFVQFTDLSPGNPTGWYWEFGDGSVSNEQHPQHPYYTAGLFDVSLLVSNVLGEDTLMELSYIYVDTAFADLVGEIADVGAKPGFDFWFYCYWANLGTIEAESCTLKILPPAEMTFYDINEWEDFTGVYSGYTFSGDTIVISLEMMEPSDWYGGYVSVYGNLPETVPIGDTLLCTSWLTTMTVEGLTENNMVEHYLEVTGSIDPNDKLCAPEGEGEEHKILSGQRLNYMIQFENKPEATAEATYIRVVDTLDIDLDWGTFAFGAMSHPDFCECEFDPFTGIISCYCDNIMLPPNENPPEGEGYFTYSVSPKDDLAVGTEISNTAWIRFDYNVWLMAPETGPIIRIISYSYVCGDANGDGAVSVGDPVYLVNYVFKGGPAPDPLEGGDANCDGSVNVGDAVYLINYVFRSGPVPCCP